MMRFTVANWHMRPVSFWLERLAYTTMASPPQWAKLLTWLGCEEVALEVEVKA